VPGPNYIWSSDGYDKLKPYGIEIYACVDAYSRCIMWIYIGVSNATAVSCYKQFLEVIKSKGIIPERFRSDHGKETTMMADAFFALRREAIRRKDGEEAANEFGFRDCYIYGTGPQNQRIESWWVQLSRGELFRTRTYFKHLAEWGLFSRKRLADRIALIAIYMPILRVEVASFVMTWNSHSIRRQPSRPNCVPGIPSLLYEYPPPEADGTATADYAKEFPEDLRAVLASLTQEWDPDAYLPAETLDWCTKIMIDELNFDPYDPPLLSDEDIDKPHLQVYTDLRLLIQEHIKSEALPKLGILVNPIGARDWVPDNTAHGLEVIGLREGDEVPNVRLDTDTAEQVNGFNVTSFMVG
jgi:hypothetical protein